jgi:hypothetical protein
MDDLFSMDDGLKDDRSLAALLQAQEAHEEELSAQAQVGRREKGVHQARDRQRRAEPACVARPEWCDFGLGGSVVAPLIGTTSPASAD